MFITTTVLDFVHAVRRDEMRDAMGYHLSARFLVAGSWSEEAGLPYDEVMESLGTWRVDPGRSARERAEA